MRDIKWAKKHLKHASQFICWLCLISFNSVMTPISCLWRQYLPLLYFFELKLINTSNAENSVLLGNLGLLTFHHWKIECQSFSFKGLGCIEQVKAFIFLPLPCTLSHVIPKRGSGLDERRMRDGSPLSRELGLLRDTAGRCGLPDRLCVLWNAWRASRQQPAGQ